MATIETGKFFSERSEQSQIKAAIVTDYFWQWAGFMVGQQKKYPQFGNKLQYIDLFAGPGRYEDGAKSTPLMILERASNDAEISARLCAIFNDKDETNTQSLEREIKALPGYTNLKNEPKIYRGEVGEEVSNSFKR
jgi:three-Cys-motif partner protein